MDEKSNSGFTYEIIERSWCRSTEYLAGLHVDRDLGHEENWTEGFDVVPFPVSDWLRQNLQLQIFFLPHLLTLSLRNTFNS